LNKYDEYTDEELISMMRGQDADGIMEHLMEKYKPLVRKKTNALYLIGGETEDLIQEGMIGLFKAVRDFREDKDSSFSHFAKLCIDRQLYSALSASNRKKHQPLNTYVSLSAGEPENGVPFENLLAGSEDDPEEVVIRQELWSEFQKKLWGNLSKMEQSVLRLYLDGNSYIQIAERMDKTPKSVDNALSRIRQKIWNLKVGD
jgi:RNA polymerase sporulation-specific sigma factor